MRILIGALLVGLAAPAGAGPGSDVGEMLTDFARSCTEIMPADGAIVVQFSVTPPGEQWYVSIDGSGTASVFQGVFGTPMMTLTLSGETMAQIHRGELTAFTAAAKGSGEDVAPLEIEFGAAADRLGNPSDTMLGFLQHFFARQRPERIELREGCSRVVHGAHAIPLYYAEGFRSAWYLVEEGQQLNEPGDTNPYPQAFVIVAGHGTAKIGGVEVEVAAGESYYVPPGSDHVLRAAPGEALTVIWLAWGEGA